MHLFRLILLKMKLMIPWIFSKFYQNIKKKNIETKKKLIENYKKVVKTFEQNCSS